MKKKTDHVATFHTSIKIEGAKRLRTVHISYRKRTKVATQLRDARTPAQRTRLNRALYFGIDCHFDTMPDDDGAVRLCWLEYRDDDGRWCACAPDVDAGDQFSLMKRGLALLEKLGEVVERKIGRPNRAPSDETFADPDVVVSALRHSRNFTEVERFEVERRGYWIEPATVNEAEDVA